MHIQTRIAGIIVIIFEKGSSYFIANDKLLSVMKMAPLQLVV